MSDNLATLLVVVSCTLGPVWIIFHYIAKMRANRKSSPEDDAVYAQLSQTAEKMERRMAVLERILDAEVPNWRQNADIGAH